MGLPASFLRISLPVYKICRVIREFPVLILSDVHIPYFDFALLDLAHMLARYCRTVVWLGDLIDAASQSPFGPSRDGSVLSKEFAAAREVLTAFSDQLRPHGGYQLWVRGNHEERVLRALKFEISMHDLAAMVADHLASSGQLLVSDYPGCFVDDQERWVLLHPAQATSAAGKVAAALSDQYSSHVVVGHSHLMASVRYRGRWLLEAGGLFDVEKLQYVAERPSARPTPQAGFWVLVGGTLPLAVVDRTSAKFAESVLRQTVLREASEA